MKFHFALLGVLCAHALARDESSNRLLDGTATSTGATGKKSPKNGFTRSASTMDNLKNEEEEAEVNEAWLMQVVNTLPPSQSNGASIMSSCPGTTDLIPVGVLSILAKNGVEYVYLPMKSDVISACFKGYNSSILTASDLVSCCDAAAERKFNSFGFDGGVCTGFTAWLPPIDSECYSDDILGSGLFIAKEKVSNFTSKAPTFQVSSSLAMAKVVLYVTDIVDACPYSKTVKVTTYSKTQTSRLERVVAYGGYFPRIYLPELCDDNASAETRTVTVSMLDWDGSVLASTTQVPISSFTGRHLLSNGVCVMYRESPLQYFLFADQECYGAARSRGASADGFLSFDYLRQELARLKVNVVDFWTDATFDTTWKWFYTNSKVNLSLFNTQSLPNSFFMPACKVNVTDGLMYVVSADEKHSTLCMDAPYL